MLGTLCQAAALNTLRKAHEALSDKPTSPQLTPSSTKLLGKILHFIDGRRVDGRAIVRVPLPRLRDFSNNQDTSDASDWLRLICETLSRSSKAGCSCWMTWRATSILAGL